MKNYLTIAAVLGAVAFVSVSFLAQATEPAAAPAMEAAAPAVAADAAVAAPAVDAATTECETSVAASFEGKTPSDEEKAAAVKACVDAKAAATTTPAEAPAAEEKAAE